MAAWYECSLPVTLSASVFIVGVCVCGTRLARPDDRLVLTLGGFAQADGFPTSENEGATTWSSDMKLRSTMSSSVVLLWTLAPSTDDSGVNISLRPMGRKRQLSSAGCCCDSIGWFQAP